MKQSIPVLTLTLTAAGAVAAHRFIQQDGEQAGASDNAIGVARHAAVAGEMLPVDVLGTTVIEAGDEIAAGATLRSDNSGRAIEWETSGARLAIALGGAGAAGEFIEALLIPNAE